jgi:hypothetical protein
MVWVRILAVVGLVGLLSLDASARNSGRGGRSSSHTRSHSHSRNHHRTHRTNHGRRGQVGHHQRGKHGSRGTKRHKGTTQKTSLTKNSKRKRTPPKLSRRAGKAMRSLAGDPGASAAQRQAVGNVLNGNALSAADQQALSGLLAANAADLSPSVRDALATDGVREALQRALDESREEQLQPFVERYLLVHNETKERLRVRVQFRTLVDRRQWQWLPSQPGPSYETVDFDLTPGMALKLKNGDRDLSASRVRIWATSSNGSEWMENQTEDHWLVEETVVGADGKERHQYQAEEMETASYSFSDQEPAAVVAMAGDADER